MNIIAKKIKKYYYQLILDGRKSFEIRKEDDCKYHTDDVLILKEINDFNEYTGRITICKITCILRDFEGLADGYVALGIIPIMNLEVQNGGNKERNELAF